jgi:hypothetical protein
VDPNLGVDVRRKILSLPEIRTFVGNLKGKKPFGRLNHRWENNIKIGLK